MKEIDHIKERLLHPKATSLSIARVPFEEVKEFKTIANDEFVGDYGLCFKAIMKDYLEYQRIKTVLLEKGEIDFSIKIEK